ncbi:hypothetical protein GL279_03530 [Paracoccus limosus]|uniref:Uncharacterized protein n=1 Tax=Paracoccus limosus TaxID=913252 RepID=A0A844GYS6_9RHOB|nr:hypothetical protein [Paracoccus limosus]MTH33662.1 hypothetical protein [Paracoccus limosus]
MGVTLYGDISPATFKGLAAAYFGNTPVKLCDAGGTPVVGATPAVAPAIQRQPSILPATAGIGDSVTLDLGAASGTPAPVASWDFTLDGASIKGRLDSGAMTMELAEAGSYALTVTWANSADAVEATPASLLVKKDETPTTPAIDYARVALAYVDAASSFSGSATDVTAITATGTGGYVFAKAGSGTAIQRSEAGFVFGDGAYVQTQVLSNQPTTDGLFVVVDVTLSSYGSNVGQLIDGTGINLKLRNSAGAIQALGPVSGQGALALGTVSYGNRILIGGQIDDVLDLLRGINTSGAVVSAPHSGLTDPLPTRFTTGRYVKGTLHRLVIIGRAEGQDWPVTLEQVFADFRRGE